MTALTLRMEETYESFDLVEEMGWNRVKHQPAGVENTIAHVLAAEEMTDLCSGQKRTAIGAANAAQRAMLSNFAEIFKSYPFACMHQSAERSPGSHRFSDKAPKSISLFEFPSCSWEDKAKIFVESSINAS